MGSRDHCFILTADYADFHRFWLRDYVFLLARSPQMYDRKRSIDADYASPKDVIFPDGFVWSRGQMGRERIVSVPLARNDR